MKIDLERIEKILSGLMLLFFTGGLSPFLPGSALSLIRYSVPVFFAFLLIARTSLTIRSIKRGFFIWLLILLAVASFLWSEIPAITAGSIRSELIPMTIFSLYFASRFTVKEQLKIVAVTLGTGALLSLFVVVTNPGIGVHLDGKHAGAWKGIYGNKNGFSAHMALTLVSFFVLTVSNANKAEAWLGRIGVLVSIALIILSTSKTGLIVFIVVLLILSIYRFYRWKGKQTVLLLDIGTMFAAGITVVMTSFWNTILFSLGRDPTLSGRTLIWEAAREKIAANPLLGYGRMAFWAPGSPHAVYVGSNVSRNYIPSHAHNGFYDLALSLGLIGLGLFFIGFLITYAHALKRAYAASSPESFWPLAFLTLLLMYNMTESTLMRSVNIYWVLYVATVLSVKLR
ncbi:O-antigen ligase family protein [Sphaerothrix gracilis]|uniref:O-antigen ligase family protein n=1 Tax=Sphaerothrix gracilis TaxID=3151835 RepID=UPI0031FD297B